MLTRRALIGSTFALAPASALAGAYTHVGPTLAVPTVSQSLKGVLDASAVPALGYAVVGKKGVTRLEVAGRRRFYAPDPVTRDDAWHLSSNTEALTSALYARIVERGAGIWGASVPLLFPDLKTDPAWADVSIEEFLSHRAGVTDVGLLDEAFFLKVDKDTRPLPVQRSEFAARVFAKPPQGTRRDYEYANANYVVAGAAIERLTRMSWEDAMTLEVFRPLALESAGFGAPTGEQPWGHEIGEGGDPKPVDPGKDVSDSPQILAPGGQIHMSLPDYARFVEVFLKDGAGFLKPESLVRIARPKDGFAEGDALGWRVTQERAWADGPVLAHEGSNTLWRALAEVAPARPLALIVVTNAGGEAGARAVQMMSSRLITEEAANA